MRQALRELDSANDLVKLDISARKAKLDSITKSVDSYLQQIKTSSVTNASLQARVAKAQAMTDSIKSNPPSDVAAVKKQLDAVQAEITAMEKEKALIPQ